jgi:SAM-dependent methyltransferase
MELGIKKENKMNREDWASLLDEEIKYWEDTVSNANGRYHTIESWFNSYSELQPEYRPYVNKDSKIIDVGAAVCTKLGKRLNGKKLNISATDVLAVEYNRILKENDIQPPVVTRNCDFESLVTVFGENFYDFVHCSNAVDHCHNPLEAIKNLVSIAKAGGYVYITVHEREAENCNYLGLHQWNFYIQDHDLYYSDKFGNVILVPFKMEKLELTKIGCHNVIEFVIKK